MLMDIDMDFLTGPAEFQQLDWGVVLDTPQCFDPSIADSIDPTIDILINETLEQQINWSAVFNSPLHSPNVEINVQK